MISKIKRFLKKKKRSGRETCLAIIVGLPTDQNFQRRRLNLTALMRPARGVAFPCCPSPSEWAFFFAMF